MVRVAVPTPPRTAARPRSFSVFTSARPAGHDVLHGLGDVGLGQITNPPVAQQWNKVALDAARIRDDSGRLLRPAQLAENETLLKVGEIARAEFLDRDRLAIELTILGGIPALAT